MTDNGPQQLRYNSNMKGLKGTVYNGGIRVPFYIKYAEKFKNSKISSLIFSTLKATQTQRCVLLLRH